MKTLLLLRHAKSSWKNESQSDHDRPLNKRGKRDAPKVAELLVQSEVFPELIISSTAKRARKTAAKVAKNSDYQGVIELTGELYLAPPAAYVAALHAVDDGLNCVLMVGHNPGIEELVEVLTGESQRMPTAALAQIELPIDSWKQLTLGTRGTLVRRWTPKSLEETEGEADGT